MPVPINTLNTPEFAECDPALRILSLPSPNQRKTIFITFTSSRLGIIIACSKRTRFSVPRRWDEARNGVAERRENYVSNGHFG